MEAVRASAAPGRRAEARGRPTDPDQCRCGVAATPIKPLPRLQEVCASCMLYFTPEAAAGSAGRSMPHVGKPVELEACVLTQRRHAPPAIKEPREAADRRGLVGAAHGPPLGACSLPGQQAESP